MLWIHGNLLKLSAWLEGLRQGNPLRFAENEFVLLMISNDWKNKGLDALLWACALLRDLPLRLLVVGSEDPIFF
jgi:glycosyltransferase involved in cell wall biosynthesis